MGGRRLLSLGLGHEAEDSEEHEDDLHVSIQSFMDGIRTTIVPRFSLKDTITDRQRRENFLRDVSDSEREAIEAVFLDLDESGDGALHIEELEELMVRIYGMEPTKLQLQQLMHAIDMDGDGSIDLDEFVSAMATVKEVKLAGEIFKWRVLFDRFDVHQSGELGHQELDEMATKMWGAGHSSTMLMKQYMMEEADGDGDGLVSWHEFRSMMMRITSGFDKVLQKQTGASSPRLMHAGNSSDAIGGSPNTPRESKAVDHADARDLMEHGRTSTRLVGYMDTEDVGNKIQIGEVGSDGAHMLQLNSLKSGPGQAHMVTGGDVSQMTPIVAGGRASKDKQVDSLIEAAPATPLHGKPGVGTRAMGAYEKDTNETLREDDVSGSAGHAAAVQAKDVVIS